MRPPVAPFGLRMAGQIENLHVTLPKRLAFENFFHRHSANMLGVGLVQMKYDLLQSFNVCFIRHSV